jgi:hypothetical protein
MFLSCCCRFDELPEDSQVLVNNGKVLHYNLYLANSEARALPPARARAARLTDQAYC